MAKLAKIFGIIFLLAVVSLAGLAAFVHYYLTEEKVKALVIPQAEAALGREVAIGDIKIGLLSGITIRDFLVMEGDRKNDFVSTRNFVLSYELLPLLQKKLIISEIRLDEPTVHITRDRKGRFNFSSLALLSEESRKKETKTGPPAAAIPLALTINQIKLNNAKITIRDDMNELPALDVSSNASFKVGQAGSLQDLRYSGSFDFEAAASYGETQARLRGNGQISQQDASINLDADLAGEQLHAEAEVQNYRQHPQAAIAISSKAMNIDRLLGLLAALPGEKREKPQNTSRQTAAGKTIADSLPPGLAAQGSIKVDKAIYQGFTAEDFSMVFALEKGMLTVKDISAKAYGGRLSSNITVDLNSPGPAYDGRLNLQSLQAGDFSSALVEKVAGMLSGSLQSEMTFSGAGTTWEEVSRVLTADGSFSLTGGTIKGTPVSMSIANLLGLQELHNISYEDISGTFNIVKGGKVKVKSSLRASDLNAEADGIIGLDGGLDLPLTLHLSQILADKLRSRASFTKYLTDDEGGANLHLKLTGSLKNPQPVLDMKNVQQQLQKSLGKEVLKQLDGSDQQSGDKPSPEDILKGLWHK